MALDDCPVECDGMTWTISYLLDETGITHTCRFGYIRNKQTGDLVAPHVWIELNDGWIVDFRLRMWLGDSDDVPHGIFHPSKESHLDYGGMQRHAPAGLDKAVLMAMTDGKLSHVKPLSRQDKASNDESGLYGRQAVGVVA